MQILQVSSECFRVSLGISANIEFMKEIGQTFELQAYIIEQCENYRMLWQECNQHTYIAKERTLYGKYMALKELSDIIRNRKS